MVVNPRIDGFGLFGAGKFNTKCLGMEFATGNITLHDGDYPDQETIFCQRVKSITLLGHSDVVITQLF